MFFSNALQVCTNFSVTYPTHVCDDLLLYIADVSGGGGPDIMPGEGEPRKGKESRGASYERKQRCSRDITDKVNTASPQKSKHLLNCLVLEHFSHTTLFNYSSL